VAVRVLIGVTAYRETADWGVWTRVEATLLPARYVDAVITAGGTPVLIPPQVAMSQADGELLLDRLDGLVISGGVDVDPARYGEQAHHAVQDPRPERDDTELLLVRLARRRGLPLLGVCRGMQVMAVEAGGTLVQHLPDAVGHEQHSPDRGVYGVHPVDVVPGSRLATVLGERVDSVPSYHHQGVASSPGYLVTATAPDGTPEAIEDPAAGFCLGVQWHPEQGTDHRLFEALVQAAQDQRGSNWSG
jgi:putative glutamine amidotransferase